MSNATSFYGGKDPRELPLYTFVDVARYLRIPASTLRAWAGRKKYVVKGEERRMRPLFSPDRATGLLTFGNFYEAYVLASLTRSVSSGDERSLRRVPLSRVRTAIAYLGGSRPLLQHRLHTDGHSVYVRTMAKNVEASIVDAGYAGQMALAPIIERSLRRVDFDDLGSPLRLHPWNRSLDEPKVVSIDPRRAFGRPTVAKRALEVDVVVDLVRAGEKIQDVARNYDLEPSVVEEVVRWGLQDRVRWGLHAAAA